MANQLISPLQITKQKSYAGLTTANHLGTLYEEKPHMISNVMSRLFGTYGYHGLDSLTSYFGADVYTPDDRPYEWHLKGDDEKSIRIIGYSAADNAKPGVGFSSFTLILEEKFFTSSDVLSLDNRDFQVRVKSDGVMTGVNTYAYEVEMITGDPLDFIPVKYLTNQSKVAKEWSALENELAKDRGGMHFTSSFKMQQHFGTVGKSYTVPANMIDRRMVISIPEPGGEKTTQVWTQLAEWTFMKQYYAEKNRYLMYGTSNKTNNGGFAMKGDSGFAVQQGAGLRNQIAPSYKFPYVKFTLEYLYEILTQLGYNILSEDKGERKFVILTGEQGMLDFHNAVEGKINLLNYGDKDSRRFTGSGQKLGFSGQYVEYKFPQGYEVMVVHLPEYDNQIMNRERTSDGKLRESRRMTILNFGTHKGKANIKKVMPQNEGEAFWYIPGSVNPMGPVGKSGAPGMSASRVAGYEMHCQTKLSLVVENPMSCAELIYNGI